MYYDHPYHAPLDHALIDFVVDPDRADGRVAVEITSDSARSLVDSILTALDTGVEAHAMDITPGGSSQPPGLDRLTGIGL